MTHLNHAECEDGVCWVSAVAECAVCNQEWAAVYPCNAPKLECPKCGFMNERPDDADD